MDLAKDTSNDTSEQEVVPLNLSTDLMGAENTSTGLGHVIPDIPFTPQQKAFIMSLFRIEAPYAPTSVSLVTPMSVASISTQRKVQALMNESRLQHQLGQISGIIWNIVHSLRHIRKLLSEINSTRFGLIDMMVPRILTNTFSISWPWWWYVMLHLFPSSILACFFSASNHIRLPRTRATISTPLCGVTEDHSFFLPSTHDPAAITRNSTGLHREIQQESHEGFES